MILGKYIANIEKVIDSSSIILSFEIQKFVGPTRESVFLKERILFINSSVLDIAVFAFEQDQDVVSDKYSYHYMNSSGEMIFRYDNAPHYRELTTFQHHKHTPTSVLTAEEPTFKNIIHEISSIIISQ